MKKFLRLLGLLVLSVVVLSLIYVAVTFPPVMAGMAAKTMCSCVFVSGRTEASVREKELKVFPGLSGADIVVNTGDSTVSASILWKTSKAIFRNRLGCTLLSERPESEVRNQKITVPAKESGGDRLQANSDSVVFNVEGLDRDAIEDAVNAAFSDVDPEKPAFTHAVVALYDGKIIGEKYADGFDQNSVLMGWSMTKSITNALVGILVQEGRLTIETPAPIDSWRDDKRQEITINHLLQGTSGLEWWESYFVPTSSFHTMFIKRDDKGGYAASKSLEDKPGTRWKYSSGSCNILSLIVRQTVGDSAYYEFPYRKLFYKIGMNHALLEPDASGTFVGSSYSYGTARDWARFGQLYLNDGIWQGERILPEGWVAYSTTPSSAATDGQYGALWWLNRGPASNPEARAFPSLPVDTYMAEGFESQYVMVIPSKKLVIVRLGVSHFGFDISGLASRIIKALPES